MLLHSSLKELHRSNIKETNEHDLYRTQSENLRYVPKKPVFLNSLPQEIVLSSKEKLVLSADVEALPQAEIKWNFNGFEIKSSKTTSVLNERNHSTLVILPPVREGDYTVSATNDIGMAIMRTKVVRVKEIQSEITTKGFTSVIPQQVIKSPEMTRNSVTVTTAEDEWLIVNDEDVYRSSTESFETVREAAPKERTHETYSEKQVTQRWEQKKNVEYVKGPTTRVGAPLPKIPEVLEYPKKEIRLGEGESLQLHAKVDAHPPVTFQWFYNNFELKPSRQVIIEQPLRNETKLIVTQPASGYYKMVASNSLGSCSTTTRVVTTTVEELNTETTRYVISQKTERDQQPKYTLVRKGPTELRQDLPSAPKITEKLPPVIKVAEETPLVLEVTAQGVPEPKFTWLFNNFELKQSSTVRIENVNTNTSRIFIEKPLSGRYEVYAENSLGRDSTSTKLLVERISESQQDTVHYSLQAEIAMAPKIVEPLQSETIISDGQSEFCLSVTFTSKLPVSYQWFKSGSLLANSIEHQMTFEKNRISLFVRKPVTEPTVYEVRVTNSAGSDVSRTLVHKQYAEEPKVPEGAPRFKKIFKSLNIEEGSRMHITVTLDDKTMASRFTWYLNGKNLSDLEGCHIISSSRESSLSIDKVNLSTNGELCVVAKNQYGSALCAADVSVIKS